MHILLCLSNSAISFSLMAYTRSPVYALFWGVCHCLGVGRPCVAKMSGGEGFTEYQQDILKTIASSSAFLSTIAWIAVLLLCVRLCPDSRCHEGQLRACHGALYSS